MAERGWFLALHGAWVDILSTFWFLEGPLRDVFKTEVKNAPTWLLKCLALLWIGTQSISNYYIKTWCFHSRILNRPFKNAFSCTLMVFFRKHQYLHALASSVFTSSLQLLHQIETNLKTFATVTNTAVFQEPTPISNTIVSQFNPSTSYGNNNPHWEKRNKTLSIEISETFFFCTCVSGVVCVSRLFLRLSVIHLTQNMLFKCSRSGCTCFVWLMEFAAVRADFKNKNKERERITECNFNKKET